MEPVYKKVWNRAAPTVQAWVHWSVLAVLTGVVCGAAGAAFYHAIGLVTAWRGAHPWLLLGMPLAGVAIVWLYQVCGMENDSGTNQIIASVRSGQRPPLRLAPLIFVGSVLTHLTGGSAGREGAALQIGGSLACQVGQRLHLGEREMKYRQRTAADQAIPITNYGILIASLNGILERTLEPFPEFEA